MALDWRWVQIVGLGMFLHYSDSCIIGYCGMKEVGSNFESCMFAFATLNFLTTLNMIPCSIANMNPAIGRLFEVAAGIFIADVMYLTVWVPLTKFVVLIPPFLGSVVVCITSMMCVADTKLARRLVEILSPGNETTAYTTIFLTALLLFVLSGQASDLFCQLRDLATQYIKKIGSGVPPCRGVKDPCCNQRASRSRSRSRVRQGLSVSEFERDD